MSISARERALPSQLEPLRELAMDLRWTWSHEADHLWRALDAEAWDASKNPWQVLRDVTPDKLERLAADAEMVREVYRLAEIRRGHQPGDGWFAAAYGRVPDAPRGVAFLSMEFGLGEALPLYAGGLGVLAGDYLKAASDLGVPSIGIGLLYQEGYFRQSIDAAGRQHELYPHNDPAILPISRARARDGGELFVELEFPGRNVRLRAWEAMVGRTRLYLLDSNDSTNSAVDRGITAKLYGGDPSVQFLQEIVLGIGGWRLIDALGLEIDVCHLNEGHAAFAVLERARCLMEAVARTGGPALSFREAFWATRAGNVFTTHTAVSAAFDRFGPQFVEQHLHYVHHYAERLRAPMGEILALGRRDPRDENEPFNLAYLAMRGSASVNGVSALHESVSRRLFQDLYPRWPESEVPIAHVTNGVHTPTWDSEPADRLWERQCGKARWRGDLAGAARDMAGVGDDELWACRTEARRALVTQMRRRLGRQIASRGGAPNDVARAALVLDEDTLTLGFARRFTAYKRPLLLLTDRGRLMRLLTDRRRPVQLLVAGKAHPADVSGKQAIREWIEFVQDLRVRDRVVFLEDYDLTLAQELVSGVDVWINTPRRPWEACGTSGMKVLVNGGLNISELDGWWAESHSPSVGWALGDGAAHDGPEWDAVEADQLYELLEREVVPEFYDRGAGLPVRWLARVRASMSELAPRFSANRMVREYVDTLYVPAAAHFRERSCDGGRLARELARWADTIDRNWPGVSFGPVDVRTEHDGWAFSVPLHLGLLDPSMVRVELYADPVAGEAATHVPMTPLAGQVLGVTVYSAVVDTTRPSSDFTPRATAFHPNARLPAEAVQICWA